MSDKNSIDIIAKELELIFYTPEVNKVHQNWKGIAEILLSKLQAQPRYNKDRVREILYELTDSIEHYSCKYETNSKDDLKKYMVLYNKTVDKAISQLSSLPEQSDKEVHVNYYDKNGNETTLEELAKPEQSDNDEVMGEGEVCYDDAGGIIDIALIGKRGGDIIISDDIEYFNKFKKYDGKQVKLIIHKCKESK